MLHASCTMPQQLVQDLLRCLVRVLICEFHRVAEVRRHCAAATKPCINNTRHASACVASLPVTGLLPHPQLPQLHGTTQPYNAPYVTTTVDCCHAAPAVCSFLSGTLPPWLPELRQLSSVVLGQTTGLGGSFPAGMGLLQQLQELNLEGTP